MPLHLRLTGLYVGLATLLVTVFGVVVYLDAQTFYLQSAAVRVREQARPVIARVLSPDADRPPDLRARAAELQAALTGRDTTAVVLDRDGAVLAGEREPDVGTRGTAVMPPGPDGEAGYIATDGARRVLVVTLPLRARDSTSGSLELRTPLDLIDEALRRQRQLVLAGDIPDGRRRHRGRPLADDRVAGATAEDDRPLQSDRRG